MALVTLFVLANILKSQVSQMIQDPGACFRQAAEIRQHRGPLPVPLQSEADHMEVPWAADFPLDQPGSTAVNGSFDGSLVAFKGVRSLVMISYDIRYQGVI